MSALSPADEPPRWTKVIGPERRLLDIPWRDLWAYRDLILLLSRRDISITHKQTVLGPLWFVIQPLLATAAFSFLFGRMAQLGTDHLPHFLFYMSGMVIWNFFAECVNKTAHTFTRNAQLFGKVYFPRLAVPVSSLLTGLLSFAVQFGILLIGLVFYLCKGAPVHPNWRVLALPFVLVQVAMLALGVGCIVSALASRYKDLSLGIGFGLQLWMFASSIVFPISRIPAKDRWLLYLNPMVPVIETFRFALLGAGLVEKWHLALSFGISAAVLFVGVMLFNRVEQTVMDTV